MANIVNTRITSEGPQKAILHLYLESDGNEGELVNRVILDPLNDFQKPVRQLITDPDTGATYSRPPKLSVLQLWSSAAWFDITLGFNSLNPYSEIVVARDADFYMDYRYFGGISEFIDFKVPTDGKLLLTTKDFAPQGSNGFMVIEVRKN